MYIFCRLLFSLRYVLNLSMLTHRGLVESLQLLYIILSDEQTRFNYFPVWETVVILGFKFWKEFFIKDFSSSPYTYVNLLFLSCYLELELLNHSINTFSVLTDIAKFFSKVALLPYTLPSGKKENRISSQFVNASLACSYYFFSFFLI